MIKDKSISSIYIFSSHFTPHIGGVESFTENISLILSKKFSVKIITSNTECRPFYVKKRKNLELFSLSSFFPIFGDRFPIPYSISQILYLMKKINNDNSKKIFLVNTRFESTSVLACLLSFFSNAKIIIVEHGSAHLQVNSGVINFFIKLYEHLITFFIKMFSPDFYAVSLPAKTWLQHFGITHSKLLKTGIIFDKKNKYIKKKVSKQFTFLYAGRLIREKGIIELVRAFKLLNNDCKLVIAGFGTLEAKMKDEIEGADNISFLGKLNKRELSKLYRKVDCFIYPSTHNEGFPTSILEAASFNTPVIISSYCGGANDIITNNINGLTIDGRVTQEKILEKLRYASSHREKINKMALKLYQLVKNEYSMEKNIDTFIHEVESSL